MAFESKAFSASREVFRGDAYRLRGYKEQQNCQSRAGLDYLRRLDAAGGEIGKVLHDGQWHSANQFDDVCKRNHVDLNTVADHILAATEIREGRRYICLPDARTPDHPPGGSTGVWY